MHIARALADFDRFVAFLGYFQLPALGILTIICYLFASYLNPGYIIGNEELQLAKAQDYDLRHQRSKSRQASTGQGGPEDGQPVPTASVISTTDAPNAHQRQKSVLHKDLHLVTRHDRNKSSQYSAHLGVGQAGKGHSLRHVGGGTEAYSSYLPS